MDVSSTILFSDMKERKDIPEEMRPVIEELTRRLDMFVGEILSDLKNSPTIFTVDPSSDNNAGIVEGAKAGDIAVFTDDVGTLNLSQF